MTLMANGKKVLGYALGDTEFYSIDGSDTSVNANGRKFVYLDGQKYVRNLIGQQGTIAYSSLALETYPRGKNFTNEDNFVCDSSTVYDYLINGICTCEGNVVHIDIWPEGTHEGFTAAGWVDVDDIDVDTDDTGI